MANAGTVTPPPGYQLDPAPTLVPPVSTAPAGAGIKAPQGYTLDLDSPGLPKPSQPATSTATLPDDYLSHFEDFETKVGQFGVGAYHDLGATAQGFKNLVDSIVGYKASDQAKDELARGWSALKTGNVSEAQMHLRNASQDIVTNHPASQILSQQWNSSARNFKAAQEAMKRGDHLATAQHVAGISPVANLVSEAFDEAISKPTPANIAHAAVVSALALSPSVMKRTGSAGTLTEEAAEPAEAITARPTAQATEQQPGIVQQILKGKNVAQPQAQEALRTAGSAGVSTAAPASLRETLTAPINATESAASSLYQQIDDAAGTDFKTLGTKLQKTNQAIRQSVDDAEEAKLEARRSNIEDTIAAAKQTALDNGVDPEILDQADAHFKRMSALTDVEAKVFKNPNVVSGNMAHGTEETVNVDAAIKALQKLQDNDEYGAPRLEQAFGKDGAKELLSQLYDAQRQGVHAVKARVYAGLIAGALVGGKIVHGVTAAVPAFVP